MKVIFKEITYDVFYLINNMECTIYIPQTKYTASYDRKVFTYSQHADWIRSNFIILSDYSYIYFDDAINSWLIVNDISKEIEDMEKSVNNILTSFL